MAEMLADVTPYLACPHCREGLDITGRAVRCGNGHVFDIARQGYVSLLPGDAHTGSADTADMVSAREELLAAGHFQPVAAALAATAVAVAPDPSGCVIDVGAGTGHYLRTVLELLPEAAGVALDISKHAARRAARAHPRIGSVVCDVWRALPLRDSVGALALSVFAPRNAGELWRVLQPGAALLVVTPTPRHLGELVESLGLLTVDQDKSRRLAEQLGGQFIHQDEEPVETRLRLTATDAERVVLMGPNAWHTDRHDLAERLAALPQPLDVTLSVTVSVYRRRDVPIDVARSRATVQRE